MELSIIVAVYNKERNNLLEKCLQSLISQTCKNYEIIAVDDASTDNSWEILKKYQKEYPDLIKLIHRPQNGKQGAARNDGIKAATGQWIGIVDADDIVASGMYKSLLEKASEYSADCAGGRVQYIDLEDEKLEVEQTFALNKTTQLTKNIKMDFFVKGERTCNKIFLRDMILKNELWYPENICFEDNAICAYWLISCSFYAHCDEIVYYYRRNPSSTTAQMNYDKFKDRIRSCNIFWDNSRKIAKGGVYKEYKEEVDYCYWNLLYFGTINWCKELEDKKERMDIYKEIQEGLKEKQPFFYGNKYIKAKHSRKELALSVVLKHSIWLYHTIKFIELILNKIYKRMKLVRGKWRCFLTR